jgi:rifampicin phosphotransferase
MVGNEIWPCDDVASERFPIWTRANVAEVFPEVVSPLAWSMWGFAGAELGWRDAFIRIGAMTADEFHPTNKDICAVFGGYCYLNVSASRVFAVRTPGLSPELMDRTFFGEQDAPPYTAHPADENAERTAQVTEWLGYVFTTTSLPELDVDRADAQRLADRRPDLTTLTDAELVARAREMTPYWRRFFGQHLFLLYCATVPTSVITAVCEAAGDPSLAPKIISAFGGVDSAGSSYAQWAMSRQIALSPALMREFDAGVDGLLDRLAGRSNDDDVASFLDHFGMFLRDFGSRGPNEWDLRSPTFGTNPEMALGMLERMRFTPDSADPHGKAAAAAAERAGLVDAIGAKLAENPDVQGQFLAAAQACGVFLPGRERTKTTCILMNHEIRLAMRELGRRFVARGVLRAPTDIALVMDEEIDAFLTDPIPFAATIVDRKQRMANLAQMVPPFVFDGAPPTLRAFTARDGALIDLASTGQIITGIGCSAGTHTGRVRVVMSPDDPRGIEPGEVMVAPLTDSAWGSLFLTAGAVIVDIGAPVSHAAIVSRELGIPCVMSATGSTQRLRDGMLVSVDGATGVITVLADDAAPQMAMS